MSSEAGGFGCTADELPDCDRPDVAALGGYPFNQGAAAQDLAALAAYAHHRARYAENVDARVRAVLAAWLATCDAHDLADAL